jgi:hypothetical protein
MAASEGYFLANPNAPGGAVVAGTAVDIAGGQYVFACASSNYNSATVALQFLLPDGSTWINAGVGTTLTANGAGVVYLGPGQVRVNNTGGTPTALFATLARIVQ